ncbi:MAG: Lrp/AsnC ligand binding domain-containing protein [Chloroflexi bacterium]|nr:Lrp/AsnC ligand binding domain-containing protein [Chloroflexota bacterium]
MKEVYSLAGEHDLIAVVRTREYDQMNDIVPGKIGRIPSITKTTTNMAFQCYSRHDLERIWSIGMDEEIALKEHHNAP